MIPFGDLQRKA